MVLSEQIKSLGLTVDVAVLLVVVVVEALKVVVELVLKVVAELVLMLEEAIGAVPSGIH